MASIYNNGGSPLTVNYPQYSSIQTPNFNVSLNIGNLGLGPYLPSLPSLGNTEFQTQNLQQESWQDQAFSDIFDQKAQNFRTNLQNIISPITQRKKTDLTKYGIYDTPQLLTDEIQQLTDKMHSANLSNKFKTGLAFQNSSDSNTQALGQIQTNDAIAETNNAMSETTKKYSGDTVNEKSFGDKFADSTFGKNFGLWSAGLDAANNIFTSIAGEKSEYAGPKGDLARSIDGAYDTIQELAGNFGPIGQLVSLGMGAGKLATNVLNKLGSGTDGMTTTDALMANPIMQLTGIGLINGFGGKKSDTITKDDQAFETVGASYTGTDYTVDDAVTKSGKKYGLFSAGSREKANREIAEARRQQQLIGNIADEVTDRFAIRNSMSAINGNRRKFQLQGGYDQSAIRAGRNGLSLKTILALHKPKNLIVEEISTVEEIPIERFQKGGMIEESSISELSLKDVPVEFIESDFITEVTLDSILPEFKEGGSLVSDNFISEVSLNILKFNEGGVTPEEKSEEYVPENIDELIKFVNKHKKVNFIQRLKDSYRETIPDWEHTDCVATHKMAVGKDRGKIKVYPMVQEIDGELHDFTDPKYNHGEYDALESAEKNNDVIVFDNWDDALWFTQNYKKYYATFDKYSTELDNANQKTIVYDEDKDEYTFNFPINSQRTLKELEWYNSDDPEAIEFREYYEPIEIEKDGKKYYKYSRKQVDSFKQGGQFNVIPDGALHARLHHMENAENLTKKGIPVVAEKENGQLEQQAEIERDEIIFRLEVTKKLEELLKKYSDNETSQKDKDLVAIEAGKLLVEEILNNTQDNTNLINNIN